MFRTMMAGEVRSYPPSSKPAWRRPARYFCRIDVSAFLVVMLLLVCLFCPFPYPMISSGISIDRPGAEFAVGLRGMEREGALIVGITSKGQVVFGSEMVAMQDLEAKIRAALGPKVERRVYIEADQRAKYGRVLQVLAAARANGIENVAFITERPRPQFLQPIRLR